MFTFRTECPDSGLTARIAPDFNNLNRPAAFVFLIQVSLAGEIKPVFFGILVPANSVLTAIPVEIEGICSDNNPSKVRDAIRLKLFNGNGLRF